jgi:hypothetical protein
VGSFLITPELSTEKYESQSYPDSEDSKNARLPTPFKLTQVLEKKEENAVVHRKLLCLSTTTNLNKENKRKR